MKGKFIALEGGEGVGKSTQIPILAQWLETKGIKVVTANDPGTTELGSLIRRIVKNTDPRYPDLRPEDELPLFMAAKVMYMREVIQPTLASGAWMLSDRFNLSTPVYQGWGKAEWDWDWTKHVLEHASRVLKPCWPDLTLVLDAPAQLGLSRRGTEKGDGTRIEDKGLEFHNCINEAFRNMPTMLGHLGPIKLIDATAPKMAVAGSIKRAVEKHLAFPA